MTNERGRLVVAMVGLAVVAGCGSGASTSTSPAGDAAVDSTPTTGPLTPGPVSSTSEPRLLLIDTDVAPDDLVAIAFLLASPAVTLNWVGEAR